MTWSWGVNQTSFFRPSWESSKAAFWSSVFLPTFNDTVCVLGSRVQYTNAQGAFGFYLNGTLLVCSSDVLANIDRPHQWKLQWMTVPNSGNSSDKKDDLEWNNAAYANGTEPNDFVYFFGSHRKYQDSLGTRQLLSRISWQDLHAGAWDSKQQFWLGENYGWHTGWSNSSNFVDRMETLWDTFIPEFTVQWSPELAAFFVLYIEFAATSVKMMTAPSLEGPWTNGEDVMPIPAPLNDTSNAFCYAVKVHDELLSLSTLHQRMASRDSVSSKQAQEKKLAAKRGREEEEHHIFSYVCNSYDVGFLFQPDNRIFYTPIFNKLTLTSA